MSVQSVEDLRAKKCVPCEGGIPPVPRAEAERLLEGLPGWSLTDDGTRIRCQWTFQGFTNALDFLNRVAQLAEEEAHHPDLHLVEYRKVAIELTTHAIGGLSENDFIAAAKIENLPLSVKAI